MTRRLGRRFPRGSIGRPRLCSLCLSILYLFSPPLLSSFFPFLALDFPLCSSVLFSSRPFSLLKDLSSRSSVRFNFYEHLLPRSLVIACLAVTLRPTLPPGTDRPRFQRTVVASSRRVPSSASFFPCSLFFLSFLPFAHLRLSLTSYLSFPPFPIRRHGYRPFQIALKFSQRDPSGERTVNGKR